jgi:GT2 family glycosyltransferase
MPRAKAMSELGAWRDDRHRRDSQVEQHGVVVICTCDRPREVVQACDAVVRSSLELPILVVDASTTELTRAACAQFSRERGSRPDVIYRRADRPGLARQRNTAIALCREMGFTVIHFIDDDTEVLPGYFAAIEARFRREAGLMGVGGVIENQPRVKLLALKSLFLLRSRRHSAVLRSGRTMLGQYPGASASDAVEWLSGCSMSYRIEAFAELGFDDRLERHSLGEDYDFSFRLSRRHRLAVEPGATCVHHVTPTARGSLRAGAAEAVETVHRRVVEARHLGMSPAAFWWSTFGELTLNLCHWIVRGERDALERALGTFDGVMALARTRFKWAAVEGDAVRIARRRRG